MWNREDLKERAKWALKDNGYWRSVFVSLILLVLTADIGWSGSSNPFINGISQNQYWDEAWRNLPLAAWFWGVAIVASLVYIFLVVNPLIVGRQRYFLEHRSRRVSMPLIFRPFMDGYWNIVKTMFMRDLIVFFFTLLLIVPGVIKSYQYYLVPSILAENPGISWRRSLRLSRDMTQGDKINIWVTELSFLGWVILAAIVTIGVFTANPSLFSAIFQNLYDRLLALTHAQSAPHNALEWFVGANDPIVYAKGYVQGFLSLHLLGLIAYYVFHLMSNFAQILVAPYYHGTFADLYAVLRARALVRGQSAIEELPGFDWPDENTLEESMRPDEPPRVLIEETNKTIRKGTKLRRFPEL